MSMSYLFKGCSLYEQRVEWIILLQKINIICYNRLFLKRELFQNIFKLTLVW